MATHFLPFSSSLWDDAWNSLATQRTHSLPFNPVAVLISSVFVPPHERRVCLLVVHRQGRREGEGVRGRGHALEVGGDRDARRRGDDRRGGRCL